MIPRKHHIDRGVAWVVYVSLLALLVGLVIPFAAMTESRTRDRFRSLTPEQRQQLIEGEMDRFKELQEEVKSLRESNTKLQDAIAQGGERSTVLNEGLQDLKEFAALTEVEGPGITIILNDSQQPPEDALFLAPDSIIHDMDVLKIVNELWNAGAEAVSVNGIRVGPTTDVRCVGTVILIDSVKIATPVTIRAIGDPGTLKGALNMPGGIVDELRMIDPAMVEIEVVDKHILPAFAGSTQFQYAQTHEPKEQP